MTETDCELKKYESTRARLILGDKARAEKFCKDLNKLIKTRDGFLKQGVNRATIADVLHVALDCLEKHGLQSVPAQKTLTEVV